MARTVSGALAGACAFRNKLAVPGLRSEQALVIKFRFPEFNDPGRMIRQLRSLFRCEGVAIIFVFPCPDNIYGCHVISLYWLVVYCDPNPKPGCPKAAAWTLNIPLRLRRPARHQSARLSAQIRRGLLILLIAYLGATCQEHFNWDREGFSCLVGQR